MDNAPPAEQFIRYCRACSWHHPRFHGRVWRVLHRLGWYP